jgi:hypothetical protein
MTSQKPTTPTREYTIVFGKDNRHECTIMRYNDDLHDDAFWNNHIEKSEFQHRLMELVPV